MKKTLEEIGKSKLVKFGNRNKFCSKLAIPALVVWMFVFHAFYYLRANGKRFSVCLMGLCLSTVYCSFSFPMFITGSMRENQEVYSETAEFLEFADESDINLVEMELIDDLDVMEEYEMDEVSHGMIFKDVYEAEDILQSVMERTANDAMEENDNTIDVLKEQVSFSKDDWKLVLINKQHSIPDDYTFTLGNISTIKGTMHCDERIITDCANMLQAAKEENIYLGICSPYRDLEYQKMLFNRKINRYMARGMSYMEAYRLSSQVVTVPGASEHQIGLALDIISSTYDSLDEGFGETDAGIWLANNCYKYGFILRYPSGKEYITGIDYEPWHFRYVGVDAATVITLEGITLEEFWEEYL